MKTRQFLLIFTLLLPIGAWADEYTDPATNVIYTYTVGSGVASVKEGTAVEAAGSPDVTGDVAILSSFTVGGNDYSVTSIEDWAFFDCSNVTSISIPNSVTSIGAGAFEGCSGLTSITIPSGVTSIEYSTFLFCSGLTSIAIPNTVTSIGGLAFGKCSGLTSITIPNSVTSIEDIAFSGCNLTSIIVDGNNTVYDSRGNCNAIIRKSDNTLIVGCKNTIIPNDVTSIGGYAFNGCSGLTSITIPNSVTSIGGWAFSECTLTSATIMGNPTIGTHAFPATTSVTQTLTPNSVGSGKWLTYYNNYANFQADANTKVYKGSVEDGNVALTAVSDRIVKAGEAVLLKSTSATITMTRTTTASADDYADNELRGLNARTATSSILTEDLSGGTIYVLGNKNDHFGFHKYTGDYMAANKAFLALPASSPSYARGLSIMFSDETTGIGAKLKDKEEMADEGWRTLDGRILHVRPATSGIYLRNGKKVIIK